VYQGPFRSFPVATDGHYLTVVRYIESNPVRAGFVDRSQEWPWSSLRLRDGGENGVVTLSDGPLALPENWANLVNVLPNETDLAKLNNAIRRGCPLGDDDWVRQTAARLKLETTLRPRGRPKG